MTPKVVTVAYNQSINPATALPVDNIIFICPTGAEFEVVEVLESHTVAGSDGGAVTADIKVHAAAVAPSAGTSVLSSTFNCKSTANTPVSKVKGAGLSTTGSARILKSGQMLSVDFTGTLTALAGQCLVVRLLERRKSTNR